MAKLVDKVIRLSDQIASNFKHLFYCIQNHIVEVGGRAATKSARNALRVAKSMLDDPHAEWFVIRRFANHHANSTVRDMEIAFERLGLERVVDFEYKKSQRKLVLYVNGTNQYIHFEGADDVERLKGYRPSSNVNYFKGLWLFEVTELESEYEIEQIISSVARGAVDDFMYLYEYNPAELKSHWTYSWLEEVSKNTKEYKIIRSTYLDLTEWERLNWLKKPLLESIERLKLYDYELFKHIYLGLPRKLLGAIYAHVFKNSDKQIKPQAIGVGVDFGWTKSATYFVATGTDYKDVQVLSEKRYDDPNRDTTSTVKKVVEFVLAIRAKYPYALIKVIPDNAEQGMVRSVNNKLRVYGIEVIDMGQKIPISERITAVSHMLSLEVLHISSDVKDLTQALEEASRDEKGDRLDDGTINIDVIDAFEYSLYPFWNDFDNLLNWK